MARQAEADGEGPFEYLERLKREHERTGQIIRAVKGGRFKGRKPDGRWWVRFGYGSAAMDLVGDTPVDVIIQAASFRCYSCGHGVKSHSKRALSDDAKNGKPHPDLLRCSGVDCSCVKTPEEVVELQRSKRWIAERLVAYLGGIERNTGWSMISEQTVFDGLRGSETPSGEAPHV